MLLRQLRWQDTGFLTQFINFIVPCTWVWDFFYWHYSVYTLLFFVYMKLHRNHQVAGKKRTWNWHKTLWCVQGSECIASFDQVLCCQTRFISCIPCCAAALRCSWCPLVSLLLQLGIRSTPNKVYFAGEASKVQLAPTPDHVFSCATLEDCPSTQRTGNRYCQPRGATGNESSCFVTHLGSI